MIPIAGAFPFFITTPGRTGRDDPGVEVRCGPTVEPKLLKRGSENAKNILPTTNKLKKSTYVKLAFRLGNGNIIDGSVTKLHQPVAVKFPILVAMGPKPFALLIVKLVTESNGNSVLRVRPNFLDQAVAVLRGKFVGQELGNFVTSVEKLGSVPPDRILSVGHLDLVGIARVPGVLGHSDLVYGVLIGKWRDGRLELGGGCGGSGSGSGNGSHPFVVSGVVVCKLVL